MRVVLVSLSLVAVAVVGCVAPASAQADRLARARVAFERGQAAFAVEDYVGAREGFQEAYQLTENPAIRYNLGLVEERAGNLEAAAAHFRFYVSRASDDEDVADAREHLHAVESQLSPRATAPPVEPNPEPGAPRDRAPTEPELGWAAFAASLGVGLAVSAGLAIGSGVVWSDANARYDELAADCMDRCDDAVVSDLDAMVTTSNALWVTALSVGVLGAAVAGVLLFSTASEGESVAVRVSPLGVVARGQFQ